MSTDGRPVAVRALDTGRTGRERSGPVGLGFESVAVLAVWGGMTALLLV